MKNSLFKALSISIFSIFALSACEHNSDKKVEKIQRDMKVTFIKHPKRFKIVMVDMQGKEYTKTSKRCGHSKQLEVGKTYTFEVTKTTHSDGQVTENIHTCDRTINLATQ